MQKLWLFIQDQSVFVYVIAGLTFFGVLTRLMLQGKLHRLLKASENMAITKERNMKTIRNHYENSLNMDIQVDHIESFVEKYILKLKYGGIPIHIWNTLVVNCMILCVATAFVGIIDAIHHGYPETYIGQLLIAVIGACAILLTVENSFRLEYYYDRLEVNIADYLDNNLKSRLGRPLIRRRERSQNQADGSGPDSSVVPMHNERLIAVASEIANQLRTQPQPKTDGKIISGRQDPVDGQMIRERQEGTGDRKRFIDHGNTESRVDRTKTGYEGRGSTRPVEAITGRNEENREHVVLDESVIPEEIPEYEIRSKVTRNLAQDQIAAGREESTDQSQTDAAIIAEVLRSYFSEL